jgi:hypothetical protein
MRAAAGACAAALCLCLPAAAARGATETDGPLARTRSVLEQSNAIVRGPGDRKEKLARLSDLLRGFLDTDALARLAAGKHLDGRSEAVITPGDRFAVDYTLRHGAGGWRATDIQVEGVSLARNFRAQFDAAVAREGFQGLLERLRAKAGDGGAQEGS